MANIKTEKGVIKSTNLIILETKEKIINTLEEAKLPITVNQFIIKEVKELIDNATNNILANDKLEYEDYLNSLEKEEAGINGI